MGAKRSAEPRLAPGPSRVQPQAGIGPQADPAQGPSRAAAVQAAKKIERGDAARLWEGRNLHTARAVRNSAGASPECEALGNARGAEIVDRRVR